MASKHGKGFTIVELIVTIVVLVILTTLVVVRLRFTQANGRDQERSIDVSTIATGLEVYYENGNVTTFTPKGYYPGATQVESARDATVTPAFSEFLEGVSTISLIAPGKTITDSFGVDPNYATSPIIGANGDGSYSDAQAGPLLDIYPYLYQPLRRNDTFCVNYIDCVKFNLYHRQEGDGAIVKIMSKNQ